MMRCKCGRDAHPVYGERCEDCYADAMAHAYPEQRYRPWDYVGLPVLASGDTEYFAINASFHGENGNG